MGMEDRLAEIDRELASFGKADVALEECSQRAQADAPGALPAVDAVLEALAEGHGLVIAEVAPAEGAAEVPAPDEDAHEDAAAAAPSAHENARARGVETVPPPGASARPASWDRRPPLEEIPDDASGLLELPESELRRESLPPVLELEPEEPATRRVAVPPEEPPPSGSELATSDTTPPAASSEPFEDSTDVRGADSLEAALGASEDIEGEPTGEISLPTRDERPLDALFDDAMGRPTSLPPPGSLADLFDAPPPEPESAPHQDLSDLLGSDLQEALATGAHDGSAPLAEDEPDHTALFTAAETNAIRGAVPRRTVAEDGLDAQVDALVADEPLSEPIAPAELPPSGEFELMIDDDVLVLDDSELGDGEASAAPSDDGRLPRAVTPLPPSVPPPAEPRPPTDPPPPPHAPSKGFLGRLLNRK